MKSLAVRVHAAGDLFARFARIILLSALFIAPLSQAALAQVAPPLGTSQNFAVLGSSTVTNTGPTVVTGDLGVDPGSAITGFPPGTVVGGTIHAADAVALQAQTIPPLRTTIWQPSRAPPFQRISVGLRSCRVFIVFRPRLS